MHTHGPPLLLNTQLALVGAASRPYLGFGLVFACCNQQDECAKEHCRITHMGAYISVSSSGAFPRAVSVTLMMSCGPRQRLEKLAGHVCPHGDRSAVGMSAVSADAVQPYALHVPEEELADLKSRLARLVPPDVRCSIYPFCAPASDTPTAFPFSAARDFPIS
jgi:hypothetical protein